jgi:hypothetical protein
LKASLPILVTLSGIVIDVILSMYNPVFDNIVASGLFAIHVPIVTDVKLVHP